MPALAQVILPFPLETAPEARVRAVALEALPHVVLGWTEPGREIMEIG